MRFAFKLIHALEIRALNRMPRGTDRAYKHDVSAMPNLRVPPAYGAKIAEKIGMTPSAFMRSPQGGKRVQ